jgi:predicted regulator of Ras-like GTPase activity (Roadblock/LC7/MglB family)
MSLWRRCGSARRHRLCWRRHGHPSSLAATWLALAQRMSNEVGQGTLREAMTKSSGGCVAIYAVGARAVLVLIGDEGVDIASLRSESRGSLDTIGALLADSGDQRVPR